MNRILSALIPFALVVATAIAPLSAAADEARAAERLKHEIRICMAELGKRADYDGATRVVHTVHAEQKNIAERELRIVTAVYTVDAESAARNYASRCVTRGPVKLVKFELEAAA